MRPILLFCLIPLWGCPKSSPPVAAFEPGGSLTMDWPAGSAEREAVRVRTRAVGDQEERSETQVHERIEVVRTAEGWQITSADGRFEVRDGAPVPPVMNALAAVDLTYEVDARGQFAGVVDGEGWEQRAREAMAPHVDERNPMARIQADMAAQVAPLAKAIQRDWFGLVELWQGLPAVPGESGQIPGTDPDGAMTMEVTRWTVDGPVPCGEGGPERCLELRAEASRPASELEQAAKPVLGAWVGALPEEPESSGVRDLQGVVRVTVVVDPNTLVPFQVERHKTLQGTAFVDDAELPFRTSDEKLATFEWTWERP